MCRSIKILRPPYAAGITDEDVRAAALQYVQTVSGFRHPAEPAEDAFNQAVAGITAITADLLARLEAATAGPAGLTSQHPQPVPGRPVPALHVPAQHVPTQAVPVQAVPGQAGPAQPAPGYAQPRQPPGQAGTPVWPAPKPPPGPGHYQPR